MPQRSSLSKVKQQYEDYPYPPRKPEYERRFLFTSITECLDALNHYGYGGKRNFHKNFRALCAGGGTGDSAIFLAEQLRNTSAEIIYLDMSTAAMEVAKARAKVRSLNNIKWVQGSLLDLPKLKLGEFDYINCSGVLHHLESPGIGLKTLVGALAPGGVMGLMLYGKYGRTAVYQMQELMRLLANGETPEAKLEICKTVLKNLPAGNWFRHSAGWFNDLKTGDAALYDLLLHSQDRAYSIPELYELVEGAGLKIAAFLGPNACDPAYYVKDAKLLARVKKLDVKTQLAIGELLAGTVKSHTFYAAHELTPQPRPDDLEMVPVLPLNTPLATYAELYRLAKESPSGVTFKTKDLSVRVPAHPKLAAVVKYMDGKRDLKEIFAKAATIGNAKRAELQEAFNVLYRALAPLQLLFLRHRDVPYYLTSQEIQARLGK